MTKINLTTAKELIQIVGEITLQNPSINPNSIKDVLISWNANDTGICEWPIPFNDTTFLRWDNLKAKIINEVEKPFSIDEST